jgi:hypothetical protein
MPARPFPAIRPITTFYESEIAASTDPYIHSVTGALFAGPQPAVEDAPLFEERPP